VAVAIPPTGDARKWLSVNSGMCGASFVRRGGVQADCTAPLLRARDGLLSQV